MSDFQWDRQTREKIVDIAVPHTRKITDDLGKAFPEHQGDALLVLCGIMLASQIQRVEDEDRLMTVTRLNLTIFQACGVTIVPDEIYDDQRWNDGL